MKVFNGIDSVAPLEAVVLTIGNFDGVHIGHQHVIRLVVERAQRINGTGVVMIFDPHPRVFFKPDSHQPMITTLEQRLELIEQLGIDAAVVQPFTAEFAELPAIDFVVKLLVGKLRISELFISSKFRFGGGAQGDVELLKTLASEHGFGLHVEENIYFRHSFVSSSFIRQIISRGEMDLAMRLLGRPYRLTGAVYRDTRRGTEVIGFPTSNIRPDNELVPTTGIYAGAVVVGDKKYPAATYIGIRPTFDGKELSVETHMLDFSGTLYNEVIAVEFYKKIRDDMKFESVDALRSQIQKDIEDILAFFKRHAGEPEYPIIT